MKSEYLAQCPPILRSYLGYMETIKGRSAQTMNEYFIDLRTFFRFLKQKRGLVPSSLEFEEISILDIDIDLLRTVTLNDAYEFMNFIKDERENGAKTRARKTTALRMFFRYLTDLQHLLEVNPLQNLETPKTKKALPKYLSLEQSETLLESVDGSFVERDYCMLTLLLNCGLRRAELAGLNLTDIGQDHTLRVRGKGNKERMLYLNDACWNALQAYLKVRPTEGVDAKNKNALFLSRIKQRISLQGVHFVVKGYLAKVPGAEQLSTHKLRHTAATLMYQHGHVDIRVLQEVLGHENLGTTEIYTHLSGEQIREAAAANPLAGKTPKRKKKTTE